MAIKKSQLYSTIWESCNALRGSMDASQYKDYVLMILFVRYLSDKAKLGETEIDIPEGCYFDDFIALKQNPHIGEEINKKLEAIREANTAFIGDLVLPNFNDDNKLGSGKTKVETLSKLIGVFENDKLDFSVNRASDDDLLGDAYEYLMRKFATESGKSKGQFYTPAEVSIVMAKLLHLGDLTKARDTIYDMTAGSASLLLRARSETNGKPTLYGQEKDSSTAALAKLNMLLHGIVSSEIKVGDTLNNPQHVEMGMLKTFDACVANPPFSQKNWLDTGGENDIYHRWNPNLLPPAKCGDYAFLLHMIASMKPDTGRGAIILPHGVLFRGNAEYEIRKHIIDNNGRHVISGIIGLPPNLFYGTNIPACIIVLDNRNSTAREGIFFIDAKDGFRKDRSMNRLREQDIKRIIDTWDAHVDVPYYARLVKWDEIKQNDYNLNIPRYIQQKDTEIKQDINAHIHGGIPASDINEMSKYWDTCPTLKENLFTLDNKGRIILKPKKSEIGEVINKDVSYKQQCGKFLQSLTDWQENVRAKMLGIDKDCHPKKLIDDWGQSLLDICMSNKSLVDPYAVYDRLMNYWADTMQDDCYMISNDGWSLPKDLTPARNGIYFDIVCDLLPVDIITNTYFKDELKKIDEAQIDVSNIASQIDEYVDENSDFFDQFEKTTESVVRKFKKTLLENSPEEITICDNYLRLCKTKKEAGKKVRSLQGELTQKVLDKYACLDEEEIRQLVVDKKWLSTILTSCQEEMKNVTQHLKDEVLEIVNRYEHTLPELTDDVAKYMHEVEGYLKGMGVEI